MGRGWPANLCARRSENCARAPGYIATTMPGINRASMIFGDLRHSFAVHRLISWYQSGADVQKLLPHLATYLGHVNLISTQVYLTMTPELLEAASARFAEYVFKEVKND